VLLVNQSDVTTSNLKQEALISAIAQALLHMHFIKCMAWKIRAAASQWRLSSVLPAANVAAVAAAFLTAT